MSVTVYGLRLRGGKEARYIGMTGNFNARLHAHFIGIDSPHRNPQLCDWLRTHNSDVEIFKIASADTRTEAFGIERAIIALCLRLEHRLFNQRGLPNDRTTNSLVLPVPATGSRAAVSREPTLSQT
jgi:predicted GIY-YIG superfamily endonuclease